MGHFRVEIDGVGGHGCSRHVKDGEIVKDCGDPHCLDHRIRRVVADLQRSGCFTNTPARAVLRHWPETNTEVVDDLLTGRRRGNF